MSHVAFNNCNNYESRKTVVNWNNKLTMPSPIHCNRSELMKVKLCTTERHIN